MLRQLSDEDRKRLKTLNRLLQKLKEELEEINRTYDLPKEETERLAKEYYALKGEGEFMVKVKNPPLAKEMEERKSVVLGHIRRAFQEIEKITGTPISDMLVSVKSDKTSK
jgi:chaperonin cofactor prefoldin